MSPPRILMADDHRIVAEGLKELLTREFEILGLVEDGRELVEKARKLRPDVIVADVTMPNLNGIDALAQLKKNDPDVKVVFLTMHREVAYAKRALEGGAFGFVLKHSAPDELVTAIRAALRGKKYITPAIAGEVLDSLQNDPRVLERSRRRAHSAPRGDSAAPRRAQDREGDRLRSRDLDAHRRVPQVRDDAAGRHSHQRRAGAFRHQARSGRDLRGLRGMIVAAATTLAAAASGQELEPRLYQNAPVGLNGIVLGYGYSTGNFLVDSSLPIEGATAEIHSVTLGYLRSIDFFGKSAKVDVVAPISWGAFEGFVAGEFRTRKPSGFADPRFRLAVNVLGAPALSRSEFATYRQKTIVALSVQVAAPLGEYDPERLINLGSNRWSFRPEAGLSHARGRWYVETAAGAWLFTENKDYFGGSSLTQTPLYFIKGNVIYNFKAGVWLALNYGFANGGKTRIDGSEAAMLQRNSRLGATFSFPVSRANSLKLVWTSGLTTRIGADFDSVNVLYQYT